MWVAKYAAHRATQMTTYGYTSPEFASKLWVVRIIRCIPTKLLPHVPYIVMTGPDARWTAFCVNPLDDFAVVNSLHCGSFCV